MVNLATNFGSICLFMLKEDNGRLPYQWLQCFWRMVRANWPLRKETALSEYFFW
jgi:hypothetical protein